MAKAKAKAKAKAPLNGDEELTAVELVEKAISLIEPEEGNPNAAISFLEAALRYLELIPKKG